MCMSADKEHCLPVGITAEVLLQRQILTGEEAALQISAAHRIPSAIAWWLQEAAVERIMAVSHLAAEVGTRKVSRAIPAPAVATLQDILALLLLVDLLLRRVARRQITELLGREVRHVVPMVPEGVAAGTAEEGRTAQGVEAVPRTQSHRQPRGQIA
jgi:hypothetical protein